MRGLARALSLASSGRERRGTSQGYRNLCAKATCHLLSSVLNRSGLVPVAVPRRCRFDQIRGDTSEEASLFSLRMDMTRGCGQGSSLPKKTLIPSTEERQLISKITFLQGVILVGLVVFSARAGIRSKGLLLRVIPSWMLLAMALTTSME